MHGHGGRAISEAWDKGVRSLHGIMINGFPNMFLMGAPQGGFTANYPHNLREQAAHISYIINQVSQRQGRTVEPSAQAEADWVATIIDKARIAEDFLASCTPGYYNNEGHPEQANRQNTTYGGGSMEYFAILEAWRNSGEMAGMMVS
jgi:cyclohexanone monooxygenase